MDSVLTAIQVMRQTVTSYRGMIDETVKQLSDEEFFQRPAPRFNSVAILLRHLGGNLVSRWTDFLTTDGEKESRRRDDEFSDWEGSRQELMEYFDLGWKTLVSALQEIDANNANSIVQIRGEPHTVIEAAMRSITHVTYHVGQIAFVSRLVHEGDWNWLTIAPNSSKEFNRETWGSSKSRAIYGKDENESQS